MFIQMVLLKYLYIQIVQDVGQCKYINDAFRRINILNLTLEYYTKWTTPYISIRVIKYWKSLSDFDYMEINLFEDGSGIGVVRNLNDNLVIDKKLTFS